MWAMYLATCASCSLPQDTPSSSPAPPVATEAVVSVVQKAPKPIVDVGAALREARSHVRGAQQRGHGESISKSPAYTAAIGVVEHARGVDQRVRLMRLPAALHGARQRVHMAVFAGELPAGYAASDIEPLPEVVRARVLEARRHLKPGEIDWWYTKTGERLRLKLYGEDGRMIPEAYVKICKAMSDPEKGKWDEDPWFAYHPRLFALLYLTGQRFDAMLELVSAYRHPRRKRRKKSFHVRGRAMDFRVRGEKRQKVLGWVESSFEHIGSGWYPNSTFIHLDVRKQSYYWTDGSKPGQRGRDRRRPIQRKPKYNSDETLRTVHISPHILYLPKGNPPWVRHVLYKERKKREELERAQSGQGTASVSP